jgi:SAM-dependent methyltransferase
MTTPAPTPFPLLSRPPASADDLFGAHAEALVLVAGAAALVGAAETGLLDAFADGRPHDPDELAATLGLHPDACARVLTMLRSLDVLTRDDAGRFAAGPMLVAEHAGPSGGAARTLQLWAGLGEYLRTGECALDRVAAEVPRGPTYAEAVAGLGRLFRVASSDLAAALGPVPGEARLLDVGAGSGQWSLAMAVGQPEARVTALDLAPVLPRFLERAAELGLADRVDVLVGDYHQWAAELAPASFDRIIAANVLHLETEDDATALIAALAPALRPGGELVIIDALPPGPFLEPAPLAAYGLSLGLRTGRGRPHSELSLRRWLGAAGLGAIDLIPLSEQGSALGALRATANPSDLSGVPAHG